MPRLASTFCGRQAVRLVSTSELALHPIGSPFSEEMPRSELVLNQRPTGRLIDGAVMEATIQWNGLYLTFITDNIMHEETLRIYLFDAKLNTLDTANLGWMYATGVFSLLGLAPPNTVRFLFFGDTDWTLELFDEERFVIPIVTDPRGVSRPFRLHRRFHISGTPKPESSSERNGVSFSASAAATSSYRDKRPRS